MCRSRAAGMGETSDMGCIYHLGQDRGTTIHGNVCSNVSSYDYGGLGCAPICCCTHIEN
jgi:hypothetical protein